MSISELEGLFERGKKHHSHNEFHILDVHPDVHLDVQFIMVVVLGLFLTKISVKKPSTLTSNMDFKDVRGRLWLSFAMLTFFFFSAKHTKSVEVYLGGPYVGMREIQFGHFARSRFATKLCF